MEALGPEVTRFAPGDRVAYFDQGYGGYAAACNVAARLPVPVPDDVDDVTAAAL